MHGSLRNKRFRLVSEWRKTEERDSRFWPREKWNKSQKMKVGEGVGQGRKLPHPLPALSLAPFFARSLTLVPRSLLLNRTETLATQATPQFSVLLRHTDEPQRRRNSCLWLQSRSVLSSFGVVLMSCRVNFHVVRSALQYSACRI